MNREVGMCARRSPAPGLSRRWSVPAAHRSWQTPALGSARSACARALWPDYCNAQKRAAGRPKPKQRKRRNAPSDAVQTACGVGSQTAPFSAPVAAYPSAAAALGRRQQCVPPRGAGLILLCSAQLHYKLDIHLARPLQYLFSSRWIYRLFQLCHPPPQLAITASAWLNGKGN